MPRLFYSITYATLQLDNGQHIRIDYWLEPATSRATWVVVTLGRVRLFATTLYESFNAEEIEAMASEFEDEYGTAKDELSDIANPIARAFAHAAYASASADDYKQRIQRAAAHARATLPTVPPSVPPATADVAEPKVQPNKTFRILGVNRETQNDVDIEVEAASEANAKVKAELQGILVTSVNGTSSQPPPQLPQHIPHESELVSVVAPNRKIIFGVVGLICGAILGVPISYYAQAGAVRMVYGIGEYVKNFPDMIDNDMTRSTVIMCVVLCGVIGCIAGLVAAKKLRKPTISNTP